MLEESLKLRMFDIRARLEEIYSGLYVSCIIFKIEKWSLKVCMNSYYFISRYGVLRILVYYSKTIRKERFEKYFQKIYNEGIIMIWVLT